MFIINLHKIHTNIAFMCKCSSMKVAILSDQINGHLNQSLGIIKLLESDYEVNVEIINIRLKNHYLRSIHQFILKHLGNQSFLKISSAEICNPCANTRHLQQSQR